MTKTPSPSPGEAARLGALAALNILDTPAESRFNDLTALAARLCPAPVAVVSLIDNDRAWFKSRFGVEFLQIPRIESFCAHALLTPDVFIVPDAATDPRFADYPVVTGELGIRFYAGAPLISGDGLAYGALCVLDTEPRNLTEQQQHDLVMLARLVMREFEAGQRQHELEVNLRAKSMAEEALRETQELLQGILDNADAMISAKDLDGRFVLVNRALQEAVGKPEGDLLGKTIFQIFPEQIAGQLDNKDDVVATTGRRQVFDEEIRQASGQLLSFRTTKFPLLDAAGKTIAVGGVSLDVSESGNVRRALAESEQRWRALVEASPSAVMVISANGLFRYANSRAADLFGVAQASELIDKTALDFISDLNVKQSRQWFLQILADGPPPGGETVRLKRPDAKQVIIECHAGVLTYNGEPAVQLEMRDISSQAAALSELRQSERRFRAVFDQSPVAMALSDEDGLWVEVNDAFALLLDFDRERLLGSSALEFAHPEDHILISGSEQGQLDSPDGVLRMEVRFVRPQGGIRWAWLSITPTDGPHGEKWTLAIAQDVTERKLAETALRESEEDLAAIAAVARCVQTGADFRAVVVSSLMTLSGASTAVLLEAGTNDDLVVTASAGIAVIGKTLSLSEKSVNAQVWRTGRPLFLADADESPLVDHQLLSMDDSTSVLWHPIVVDGVVLAMLNATWRERMPGLSHRAVRAALMIADEAGASLHADALRVELERAATTDPLTGALNRRAWESRVRTMMTELTATGGTFAVALMDLDFFKKFNDTHGHTAGDLVLRDFSANVERYIRDGDLFARWGGEEFILALREGSPQQLDQLINRIRDGVPFDLTCSIGHTTWDRQESIGACISRADAALYDAKRSGRDQVADR